MLLSLLNLDDNDTGPAQGGPVTPVRSPTVARDAAAASTPRSGPATATASGAERVAAQHGRRAEYISASMVGSQFPSLLSVFR